MLFDLDCTSTLLAYHVATPAEHAAYAAYEAAYETGDPAQSDPADVDTLIDQLAA